MLRIKSEEKRHYISAYKQQNLPVINIKAREEDVGHLEERGFIIDRLRQEVVRGEVWETVNLYFHPVMLFSSEQFSLFRMDQGLNDE